MIRTVCLVSREYEGVAGAGGLKDVVRALAWELGATGRQVTVIIPRYAFVPEGQTLDSVPVTYRGNGSRSEAVIRRIQASPHEILTIDHPCFAGKKGVYTYTIDDAPSVDMVGAGHRDANEMNCVLQEAAVRYLHGRGTPPDIVHGHDAHTGLLPLYMQHVDAEYFAVTASLTTIHNAGSAYQQIPGKPADVAENTGLPLEPLEKSSIDGNVNPFLAAGLYGTLSTVSPGYARELLSGKDIYSGNLGPILRAHGVALKGITNGLDTSYWLNGPGISDDRTIPGNLYETRPAGSGHRDKRLWRGRCIDFLEQGPFPIHGGFPGPEEEWILFHGRLTEQKGLDEILRLDSDTIGALRGFRLIVYGQGDPEMEALCRKQAEKFGDTGRWTFLNGYDERLTRWIIAASSWTLVPSRWEPCGQIDMVGQLLGALPIVRRVGGLRKVRNSLDGLSYGPRQTEGLRKKILRAVYLSRKKKRKVRMMRRTAENTVYGRRSWRKVIIRGYLPLYRRARRR